MLQPEQSGFDVFVFLSLAKKLQRNFTIVAPPKNIRIERRKFPARRGAETRRALAVRKVFSDEGLLEIYKLYVRVFRWSDYI